MRYFYIISVSILLFCACKKDKISTATASNSKTDTIWKEYIIDGLGWEKIILNSYASSAGIRMLGALNLLNVGFAPSYPDTLGNSQTYFLPSIEYKPTMGATCMAYYTQYFATGGIVIANYGDINDYDSFLGIGTFHWGKDSSQYTKLNISYDVAALNTDNVLITSVVKAGSSNITILEIRYVTGIYLYSIVPDTASVHEVELPESASVPVVRMEAFNKNFFVSTTNNSYLVREDGSYKVIFQQPVSDYFTFNGNVYADLGNQVYFSSDDGENWTLVGNNLGYSAFRQFAQVDTILCFYKDDSLFVANPTNFLYKKISNSGMQTNKITSVSFLRDSVYITTLSGLFVKPEKYFLK